MQEGQGQKVVQWSYKVYQGKMVFGVNMSVSSNRLWLSTQEKV